MKEFIVKHPIITFFVACMMCDTIYNCVKIIKNEGKITSPIHVTISKGDEKGA